MMSAQFVAVTACAITAAVVAVVAVYHGHWVWAGVCGLVFVGLVVRAWVLAMGLWLPIGKRD